MAQRFGSRMKQITSGLFIEELKPLYY